MSGPLAAAARFIATYGDDFTLKRQGEADLPVKGKRMTLRYGIDPLGNSSVQQSFRLRIGTAELAASSWSSKVPARTDTIVVAGRTRAILNIAPVSVGATVAMYEFEVAG